MLCCANISIPIYSCLQSQVNLLQTCLPAVRFPLINLMHLHPAGNPLATPTRSSQFMVSLAHPISLSHLAHLRSSAWPIGRVCPLFLSSAVNSRAGRGKKSQQPCLCLDVHQGQFILQNSCFKDGEGSDAVPNNKLCFFISKGFVFPMCGHFKDLEE